MPRVSFRTADGKRVTFTAKPKSSKRAPAKRKVKSVKGGANLALRYGAFRKGASVKAPKGAKRGSVIKRAGGYYRVMKDPHGRGNIDKPITKPR